MWSNQQNNANNVKQEVKLDHTEYNDFYCVIFLLLRSDASSSTARSMQSSAAHYIPAAHPLPYVCLCARCIRHVAFLFLLLHLPARSLCASMRASCPSFDWTVAVFVVVFVLCDCAIFIILGICK